MDDVAAGREQARLVRQALEVAGIDLGTPLDPRRPHARTRSASLSESDASPSSAVPGAAA